MSTMRIHHFLEQQCGSNTHIIRGIVEKGLSKNVIFELTR